MTRTATGDKRQELIEIASRLFYEQGYGATGIKQVIEEAGIAKGTFYTHFKSKEELGLAWLQARHAVWTRWLEESVAERGGSAEAILGAFEFLAEWMKSSDYRGCAFIDTMAETPQAESPMRAEVEAHKLQLLRWFERHAIDHFQGRPKSEAKAKGQLLYLLFEGSLVESQLFQDPWPIETAHGEARNILQPAP